jgi:flagellar biosynthesis regulator FlaF
MELTMINEIKQQLEGAGQEAELLGQYAQYLDKAAQSGSQKYKVMVLDENLKMWVAIEASMKNPNNMLPQEIKSNLMKLSKYVEQVTLAQGEGMSEKSYHALAEINRQISAGLLESVNVSMAQQEAYYLAKSGLDLSEAQKNKDTGLLAAALDANQQLWLMIRTLMVSGKSKQPKETQENLVKLADYVVKNTVKLNQELDKADDKMLNSFININRQISEGLLGRR